MGHLDNGGATLAVLTWVGLVERPHRVRRGQTCSGRGQGWVVDGPLRLPGGADGWAFMVARRTPVSRPFAGGSPKNLPLQALAVARLSSPLIVTSIAT